jgi:DNA-binding transcriptional LysR family regulator
MATRSAEKMLPAAEAMEASHGRLTREALDLETEAEGVVRIAVAPGMCDAFVAPALVRLRAKHPKIDIELDAAVRPVDLTRHEADLALRSTRPHGAELVVTKIGTGTGVAAGSPAFVKRIGRLTSWNDVPWISWDRDLTSFPPARWVAQYAPKARIALRTSQFTSQLVAAQSGLGAILVPTAYMLRYGLKPLLYADALEPSIAALPTDDLWLIGHRALRDVPRVAAVWTFLAHEMRALARSN